MGRGLPLSVWDMAPRIPDLGKCLQKGLDYASERSVTVLTFEVLTASSDPALPALQPVRGFRGDGA
jgi:hypothetical protein